jgi:threonine/homoserine/homoserine lactone efflux protein
MFVQGLAIGFSIAAPVGPIGLLCIRRSLNQGAMAGLLTGLGAATADACYGCVAGFGLSAVSNFLIRSRFELAIFGGAFLLYLGARILLARPVTDEAEHRSVRLLSAYGSTLLLTLSNPLTILSFTAVFASFGFRNNTGFNPTSAAVLVGGVFLGSALWWLLLSGGVGLLKTRIQGAALVWVNRISGTVLILFGIYALAQYRLP